jgi:hypothetical protein
MRPRHSRRTWGRRLGHPRHPGSPPSPTSTCASRTVSSGLLSWAGFGLLTSRLREAGERTFSVLGLCSIAVSTPLFILFNLAALTVYDMHAAKVASSGSVPVWSPPLVALSLVWLGLYAVLTHLAVALYAMALANVGLLGKFGRGLFIMLGTIAAASALVLVSASSPTLREALYPFMIPAVPTILPYLMGVSLVRRVGDPLRSPAVTSALHSEAPFLESPLVSGVERR